LEQIVHHCHCLFDLAQHAASIAVIEMCDTHHVHHILAQPRHPQCPVERIGQVARLQAVGSMGCTEKGEILAAVDFWGRIYGLNDDSGVSVGILGYA
jgi:hypothetical protein